jgi:hypothetical protein
VHVGRLEHLHHDRRRAAHVLHDDLPRPDSKGGRRENTSGGRKVDHREYRDWKRESRSLMGEGMACLAQSAVLRLTVEYDNDRLTSVALMSGVFMAWWSNT